PRPPRHPPAPPFPTRRSSDLAGAATAPRNNLPPAAVLPERLVHYSGRVLAGQFAGVMGTKRNPWFIEASAYDPKAYGAYPEYELDRKSTRLNSSHEWISYAVF